jgi:tight adherence protein B
MADRLGNLFLHQLAQVVDVSLKTGLNLQEALDTMVDEIRTAQELRAEREAATSAFHIVTYLFTGLELLMVGNLLFRSPEHLLALWQSPMGQMIAIYVTVTTVVALLLPRFLVLGHDLAG